MIKVYHNPKSNFFSLDTQDFSTLKPDDLVALVATDDLEEAFKLTNSIEAHWSFNQEVKVVKRSRSTSVGDFMFSSKTKEWWGVDSVGFKKILDIPTDIKL